MKTYTSFIGHKTVFAALTLILALSFTGCSSSSDSDDGGSSVPAPDFTVSDMEGNWSMHGISFGLMGSDDGNFKGQANFNASGNIIDGSFEDSSGMVAPLTDSSFSFKDNGEFTGTIESGSYSFDIYGGKMTPSKNITVAVDTSTTIASNDLSASIKQGGTFATSDLQGKWHMFGPSVNGGALGSPEGTIWGSFELDTNGKIIGGGVISTSDGMTMTAVDGAFVMNTAGELNGAITASVAGFPNFDVTVGSGKMDPSKNIIFMTSQTDFGSNELIAAVRSGGTFATADMEGKWYMYGVSTGGLSGKTTVTGSLQQDAAGQVIDGSLSFVGESSGLQPVPATVIPGGTLALDVNGELSGSSHSTTHTPQGDVNSTMTITSGKMAPSKNMSIWVLKTDVGQNGFVISIKGN